jgi:hypothetical protein
MKRKTHRKPVPRAVVTRPRDAKGRWLSKRQIAALKGVQTRRRAGKQKAKATAARVAAAKHGQQARERRRLTAAQIERRRKDARRVTQKVRRAKKDERATTRRGPSSRLISSRSSKGRPTKSRLKRPPSTESVTIGKRGTADRFAAQIQVRFDMPEGFKPTRALTREAIRYRIKNGIDAPRTHTKILRWRNPGRRMGEDRAWRQGNQPDAWATLGAVIEASL